MIDYNAAAKSYDNTRNASEQLIALFHKAVHFSSAVTILDFGCGTGNYLNLIQTLYGCQCYGVEPSEGMRAKAKEKNSELIIEKGDHTRIPFPDRYFDFTYMTDVVHHVPDSKRMFHEIKRVLKQKGKLCIATQSHPQIESRFFNQYFPSLSKIEKKRYPDVAGIISNAKAIGFDLISVVVRPYPDISVISAALVRTVEEKNWSMFRLLGDEEYAHGLKRLKNDLGAAYETPGAGDSLIWLEST